MTSRPTLLEIARELAAAVSDIDRAEPDGDVDARVRAWERAYRAQDALDAYSGRDAAAPSRDAARGVVVRRAHALMDYLRPGRTQRGGQLLDLMEGLEAALAACGWPVPDVAGVGHQPRQAGPGLRRHGGRSPPCHHDRDQHHRVPHRRRRLVLGRETA